MARKPPRLVLIVASKYWLYKVGHQEEGEVIFLTDEQYSHVKHGYGDYRVAPL
jgi:hypothetical protein